MKTDTRHTAIRNEQLEMLRQLTFAWDTLYAMERGMGSYATRSERLHLVRTQVLLMNEFDISYEDLDVYMAAKNMESKNELT